jgi:hypothetical protein
MEGVIKIKTVNKENYSFFIISLINKKPESTGISGPMKLSVSMG